MFRLRLARTGVAVLGFVLAASLAPHAEGANPPSGDAAVLASMRQVNHLLRSQGSYVAVEAIEFFTVGEGRPSIRIHQLSDRWVASDSRRNADGDNLTYLVDQSDGATINGLTNIQTEAAIDRAMNSWQCESCLRNVDLIKRTDDGVDPDFTDSLFGFGDFGEMFRADIVYAGWVPRAFFEVAAGSGCGHCVLAISMTYIFDEDGIPTDVDGDNYLDTALTEIYFNQTFGDPADDRVGNPWAIDETYPSIDVETIALHETGHALGLGHFGPSPRAVMNPRYTGIHQTPDPVDRAGLCAVWASWPR